MPKMNVAGLLTGLFLAFALPVPGTASIAFSAELPKDDPGLFTYLFSKKTIPADWISAPARDELTPAMLAEIAERLTRDGGRYSSATRKARGWLLEFQNGTVRSRIVRAQDRKIVGVFFSGLE